MLTYSLVCGDVITSQPWHSDLNDKQIEQLGRLDTLSSEEKYALAQALIEAHQDGEAEYLLLELTLTDSQRTRALLQLGYLYLWNARYLEASKEFAKVVRVHACDELAIEGLEEAAEELKKEPAHFQNAIMSYELLLSCDPDNVKYLFYLGQLNAWTDHWPAAEEYLVQALKLDPGYSDAEVQLGILYYWQRKYKRAADLLYYHPRNPAAEEVYQHIQEIFHIRDRSREIVTVYPELVQIIPDDEKLIAMEREEIEMHPENAEAHFRLGRLYVITGQVELGRQLLEKSVALEPDLALAQIQLGYIYLWEFDYARADQAFIRASRTDACNNYLEEGLFRIALEYESEEESFERIFEIYRQLIKCDPSNWRYFLHYGRVLSWDGQYEEAEYFLKRALRRNSNCIDCALQIGLLQFWEGHDQIARKIFEKFHRVPQAQIYLQRLRLASEDFLTPEEFVESETLVARPRIFDQKRDYSAQIEVFRRGVAGQFPRKERWLYLSRLYIVNNQLEKARRLLGKLVRNYPDYADGRLQYGFVLLWEGDLDRARFQFERAIALGRCGFAAAIGLEQIVKEWVGNNARLSDMIAVSRQIIRCRGEYGDDYYSLGKYLSWNGQWQEAESALQRAIYIDPNHIEAQEQLAKLYLWQMKLDEAQEVYERHPKNVAFQRGVDRVNYFKVDFTETMRLMLSQVIAVPITTYDYAPLYVKEIIKFKEENPEYWRSPHQMFTLAQLNLLAGRKERALDLLQEAYHLDPNYLDPVLQMAYIKLWDQEWGSSYRLFSDVLSADPCNSLALSGYEQIGVHWGQRRTTYKSAMGIYQVLHKCEPNDANFLVNLGRLMAFTGNREGGREMVEKALELDPYNFNAEIQLGIFDLWARRYDQAEEIFARYPHRPYAVLLLARVKMSQGKLKVAEKILLDAIERFEKDKELRFLLVQVYRKQLRYHKAMRELYILTDKHVKDQRFWNDAWIVKSHTNPSILGLTSFTYSKEGDPDLSKEWVVRSAYKRTAFKFSLPIHDRLLLYTTPMYYTERELSITNPGTVNYNNYIRSIKFGGNLILSPQIDFKASVDFLTPGQIGSNTVFPLNTAPNPTQIKPEVGVNIDLEPFSFAVNYTYDAFFIKNFDRNLSQLLGTHEVAGGGSVNIPNWPRFKVSTDWSVKYYDTTLGNVPNQKIHRSVDVRIGVPYLSDWIVATYNYEFEAFQNISPNYNSFKRRQKNRMGFEYAWTYNWMWTLGFSYLRTWKSSLGESNPVGTFDVFTDTNYTQANKFRGFFDYRIRDRLKIHYEMSWLSTTYPYQATSFKAHIQYKF